MLGGTSEASQLTASLRADGLDPVLSFAGRTASVMALPGSARSADPAVADLVEVRVGGFGGADGLARYLDDERIGAVVCATHPFAARMPFNVAEACSSTATPVIRLLRPPWSPTGGDRWIDALSLADAAQILAEIGARRVLLTTGRQELAPFAALDSIAYVIRSIDPPDISAFADAITVLDRGPFEFDDEIALLRDHRIDAVVTKNSGGTATAAKLAAARSLGLPVVMVQRPSAPKLATVSSVDEVRLWLANACSRRPR